MFIAMIIQYFMGYPLLAVHLLLIEVQISSS